MKRYIALVLCAALLCGCGGDPTAEITEASETAETVTAATADTTTAETEHTMATSEAAEAEPPGEESSPENKGIMLSELSEDTLYKLFVPEYSDIKYAEVAEENEQFASLDGIVYTKDMKTLVWCPRRYAEKNVIIPDGTESIGDSAFYGCTDIESIEMPDSVMRIGRNAFGFCKGLKNIRISDELRVVGGGCFYNCESLSEIMLPDSAVSCEDYMSFWAYGAFSGCRSLKTVRIPCSDAVCFTDTPAPHPEPTNSFSSCPKLESFVISENADDLCVYNGALAFSDLTAICRLAPASGTEIFTIPSNTSLLGAYAFEDCVSLRELIIEKYDGEYERDFWISGGCTIAGCVNLEKIYFPDDVTDITGIEAADFPKLTFFVKENSAAEGYAKEHDIPLEYY